MNVSRWRARRRIAALTKAVYDSAPTDQDDTANPVLRMLPGGATVAALIIVIVCIGIIGVWRHATVTEQAAIDNQSAQPPTETTTSDEATPSDEDPAPQRVPGTHERPNDATPTPGQRPLKNGPIVYITGAVAQPGVLTLPPSSRVVDAITAAGGPQPDANLTAINLARTLIDGEHIHVATTDETPTQPPNTPTETSTHSCIQLDTATASDLQTLPGIGPALATRILTYRTNHPHIATVDELDTISGIGPSLIDKIRPHICP